MTRKASRRATRKATSRTKSKTRSRLALPAKLTRPQARTILARERLLQRLDGTDFRRLTWIAGPAGSGKTSLASSWVETRARSCLWYRIDGDDADPATFFHYLRLAGVPRTRRVRVQLPPFTPEVLPNLELYARRYFEMLFRWYTEPFVMVFDNCHEVPQDAPVARLLWSTLFDCLPSHGHLLCLTRGPMPPTLVRWSAEPGFQRFDFEELRFTDQEAMALGQVISPGDGPAAAGCNRMARGWVMGLKLLLGAPSDESPRMSTLGDVGSRAVFDYYAAEVLDRTPLVLREMLMRASILDDMDAESVEALTETPRAAHLLEQLFADRLFVERRRLPHGPSYRFHPLFRDFLRTRLASALSSTELAAHRQRCALLLEQRGQLEAATAIALECADCGLLARLILQQAPQLAEQGRLINLQRWLQALPQEYRDADGWLLYWFGISLMAREPERARASLQQAYRQFHGTADVPGAWLATSALICSHFLGWGAIPGQTWQWVDTFEALRADNSGLIPAGLEPQILVLLGLLAHHCPDHALSRHMSERAQILATQMSDAGQRAAIGAIAVGHLTWQGDEARAWALIDELGLGEVAEVPASIGGLALFQWRVILLWTGSEHERCFTEAAAAREVARQSGLGLVDPLFLFHVVLCALSAGDAPRAGQLIREAFQSLQPYQVTLTRMLRGMQAMQLALVGQTEAGTAIARALRAAGGVGDSASTAAMDQSFLATALLEGGAFDDAESCAMKTLELAGSLPSDRWAFEGLMLLAAIELERGNSPAMLARLQAALRIARERNFRGGVSLWQPKRTARLLAAALRHHIEPEYVRRLIRCRSIAAPDDHGIAPLWPVRVRVATLGRFGMWIEDQPCPMTGSAGRKPLEVLKALIGFGTSDVSLAALGAALWPELDGAAAHNACHVAIYRLRRMLRSESAIRIDHGTVTLNRAESWVDVESFRDLASRIRTALSGGRHSSSEMQQLAEQLVNAYPGHFLPGEERAWAVGVREQLRARFTHLALSLSVALERADALEASIALNRRGIELDPLAESFHRGLMRTLIALGRKAEALEAFRHCRAALLAGLRVEPSAETYALQASIRQD